MKRRKGSPLNSLKDDDGYINDCTNEEAAEDLPLAKRPKLSINQFDTLPSELLIHIFNLADLELSG